LAGTCRVCRRGSPSAGCPKTWTGRVMVEVAMNWEQRYRLRRAARASLMLWAGLALLVALVAAPAVRWLDRETGWVLFGFSSDGARAVLAILAGSMLSFIVFVLSATLIVVQLASGQSTPRVIAAVMEAPVLKVSLSLFTFTYGYTLSALGRAGDQVADLHVSAAVLLNLACVVVFLHFAQRLATGLRPVRLIRLVAMRALTVIEQVYPATYDPGRFEEPASQGLPAGTRHAIVLARRSGAVLAFGATELVRLAERAGAVIELVPQVGGHVAAGDPLFRVTGEPGAVPADALRGCVAIGPERNLEQDPRFAFRVLVDIACKALSSAINDPTTAVQAIDRIQHLLLCLAGRQLDDGRVRNPAGILRLVYGTPNWPDFVELAVSEVRLFGAGNLQVIRRLQAMLARLIESVPESRRPPLRAELALLGKAVERTFLDEEDRRRAMEADYQGIGASA
jgi:uncharacterized membrane protein